MRKKTVKTIFSNIFWYSVYLMPLLITVACLLNGADSYWTADFGDYRVKAWTVLEYNVREMIYGTEMYDIFYSTFSTDGGTFALFSSGPNDFSLPLGYMAYFVNCVIFHVFVDFILFIPRLCHKFMNKFTRSDDGE